MIIVQFHFYGDNIDSMSQNSQNLVAMEHKSLISGRFSPSKKIRLCPVGSSAVQLGERGRRLSTSLFIHEAMPHIGGVRSHAGTPIAGWFLLGEIP